MSIRRTLDFIDAARARQVPADAQSEDRPDAKATVFRWTSPRGMFAFALFRERAAKPCTRLDFRSESQREAAITERLTRLSAHQMRRRAERIAAAGYRHTLRRDDVLCAVWGYDQTNVDFYQVIDLPSAKFVTVRKIEQQQTEAGAFAMRGTTVALPGEFIDHEPARRVRVGRGTDDTPIVRLDAYRLARKWDGTPMAFSTWA